MRVTASDRHREVAGGRRPRRAGHLADPAAERQPRLSRPREPAPAPVLGAGGAGRARHARRRGLPRSDQRALDGRVRHDRADLRGAGWAHPPHGARRDHGGAARARRKPDRTGRAAAGGHRRAGARGDRRLDLPELQAPPDRAAREDGRLRVTDPPGPAAAARPAGVLAGPRAPRARAPHWSDPQLPGAARPWQRPAAEAGRGGVRDAVRSDLRPPGSPPAGRADLAGRPQLPGHPRPPRPVDERLRGHLA